MDRLKIVFQGHPSTTAFLSDPELFRDVVLFVDNTRGYVVSAEIIIVKTRLVLLHDDYTFPPVQSVEVIL